MDTKQLAEKLHISSKSVSRWETGNGYPDIALLPSIAKILELDYRELLEGNEYIIARRKKKLKLIKIIIGCIVVCLIIGIIAYMTKPMIQRQDTRDLLIHGQWENINFTTDCIYDDIDIQQQSYLLDCLQIDEWKKVDCTYDESLEIEEGIQQWHMSMIIEDETVLLNHYSYQNHYYMIVQRNDTSTREVYILPHSIVTLEKYIQDDIKNWYGLSQNHSIQVKTSLIKELSKDDNQMICLEYSLTKDDIINHHYIFIEDQTNQRFYFILNSQQYDFQQIDAAFDKNVCVINLVGKDYVYKTPYIYIFEIQKPCQGISMSINGEEIDQLSIFHTLEEAKKVETFE